jgi:tRNA (guanine26-N2/guanine27-N2)-dimethyltransferase
MSDVREGATRIAAPAVNVHPRGPGRRAPGQAFYNPGMALNRDLSVLLVEAEGRRKGRELDVADALAGTGARSVRLATEVGGPLVVHANDAAPAAAAAIRQSARLNGVADGRLRVTEGDAHLFLASQRFDVVDIDPHGSPMPFLDAAMRATRPDGLVCVTATDTGALAGTYPRVARRRYDAHHGLHAAPWRAEVGLRILASAVVRAGARFDRVAQPVLSVAQGHWMRVVARVSEGSQAADDALRRLKPAVADAQTGGGRFLERNDAPVGAWAGPLWSGPLHDAGFVAALRDARGPKVLARPREAAALLETIAAEAEAPAFWIVPDALQKDLGRPPRRDALIARLRETGHAAARTHMDPQGIRTDAGLEELRQAWAGRAPGKAP